MKGLHNYKGLCKERGGGGGGSYEGVCEGGACKGVCEGGDSHLSLR